MFPLAELVSEQAYDYIIMDCPPSLGVLTINALTAAGEVFIPLQPHFLALHGLSKLLEATKILKNSLLRLEQNFLAVAGFGWS